jgi:hypothetical protein
MKPLITILFLLIFNIAKAQDSVCIPYPVAKQITQDLISGDSAKAELGLITQQLTLTEQKVLLKDSVINTNIEKNIICEERIKNEQLKYEIQGRWVEDLRKQNKELQVKAKFTKIMSGMIIGILTYLLITK